jgi:signal recognition particle GTPase
VPAAVVSQVAAALTAGEAANVLGLTPGQVQRVAAAAAVTPHDVVRILEEYMVARALHNEARVWKREGRSLPKTPTALQEFLQSAMARAKQQQVVVVAVPSPLHDTDPDARSHGRGA